MSSSRRLEKIFSMLSNSTSRRSYCATPLRPHTNTSADHRPKGTTGDPAEKPSSFQGLKVGGHLHRSACALEAVAVEGMPSSLSTRRHRLPQME